MRSPSCETPWDGEAPALRQQLREAHPRRAQALSCALASALRFGASSVVLRMRPQPRGANSLLQASETDCKGWPSSAASTRAPPTTAGADDTQRSRQHNPLGTALWPQHPSTQLRAEPGTAQPANHTETGRCLGEPKPRPRTRSRSADFREHLAQVLQASALLVPEHLALLLQAPALLEAPGLMPAQRCRRLPGRAQRSSCSICSRCKTHFHKVRLNPPDPGGTAGGVLYGQTSY